MYSASLRELSLMATNFEHHPMSFNMMTKHEWHENLNNGKRCWMQMLNVVEGGLKLDTSELLRRPHKFNLLFGNQLLWTNKCVPVCSWARYFPFSNRLSPPEGVKSGVKKKGNCPGVNSWYLASYRRLEKDIIDKHVTEYTVVVCRKLPWIRTAFSNKSQVPIYTPFRRGTLSENKVSYLNED